MRTVIRPTRFAAALFLSAVLAAAAHSQPASAPAVSPAPATSQVMRSVPWAVGEYMEYNVKFGFITAGTARMQVTAIDTLRSRAAWRVRLGITGGIPFARVNDSYESWMDVESLNSLRFVQDLLEVGKSRKRAYEIFPERSVFSLNGNNEEAGVAEPLDDASFLFFVRSIPLVVGDSLVFHRYFNPKSNPVIIRVIRRDTARLEAGVFPAIVVQPIIKTGGLFSQNGRAEVWLSDDKRRLLLQITTHLSIGSLNLYLRKYSGTGTPDGN